MKRKNYIFSLASALLMGTMTMSLTACSNEDNVANNTQQPAQGEVRTYTVSIPATFSDNAVTRAVAFDNSGATPAITATFSTTEKVYVYNKTKNKILDGYLQPTNLRIDDTKCDLEGVLTGTLEVGDEIWLLYNPSSAVTGSEQDIIRYTWHSQDGTAASVLDGATSTVTLDGYTAGKLTTTAIATFTNLQSIFRFKFNDGTNDITVRKLGITSQNNAIYYYQEYQPLVLAPIQYGKRGLVFNLPTPTNDFIYAGIRMDKVGSDVLTFDIIDSEDNHYTGTKTAPAAGFDNGNYYYNTSPIIVTADPYHPPMLSRNDGGTIPPPNENNAYMMSGNGSNPIDLTVNGDSYGYTLFMQTDATIRLQGNGTARYGKSDFNTFISSNNNLTIILDGDYEIICKGSTLGYQCISSNNLYLTGNGKLTVTTKSSQTGRCGLYGSVNYYVGNNNVSNLAPDANTTIIRSAQVDNPDGSHTWTYTVTTVTP